MPDDYRKDFLKSEYATAVDLVKYYDGKELELLKFASGLTAAVPTAVFGFYALKSPPANYTWDFVTLISAVTAMSLLSILLAMIQNRVYFVFPARQANGLRKYFFEMADNNKNNTKPANFLYEKTDLKAYSPNSAHTFQLLFVALQTALFFGITASGIGYNTGFYPIAVGSVVTVLIALVLVVGGHKYLSTNRPKADSVWT